ncbi:MAG: hypothetical protein NZM04_05340 [Methylacidiphilales bacterium]|nr:hypothetical protein [Candidatus Methylacidiphilales bacterium]
MVRYLREELVGMGLAVRDEVVVGLPMPGVTTREPYVEAFAARTV